MKKFLFRSKLVRAGIVAGVIAALPVSAACAAPSPSTSTATSYTLTLPWTPVTSGGTTTPVTPDGSTSSTGTSTASGGATTSTWSNGPMWIVVSLYGRRIS